MPAHAAHNYSTYTNHECRCAECRAANAAQQKVGRIRRHAAMEAGEVHPEHGTESTYFNYMCRCASCRAAHAATERARRARVRTN